MKTLAIAAAIFGIITSAATSIDFSETESGIITGRANVTDGDSLRIGEHRIRLFGIDAPETSQTCEINGEPWDCGRASRRALERLADGEIVTCQVRDMHRTRFVSVCHTGGIELNVRMVRRGWAVAYTNYSLDYVDEEFAARAENLALWRSAFERPHAYRARLRDAQTVAREPQVPPSTDCNIKGNISRSGTRIYHMPGQADYQRTRINEANGEQWFCSSAEAEQAGWRRAMR